MSNFSFSHSVFYPLGELSAIVIKFEIVVCKLFHVGRVKNLLFGKGLKEETAEYRIENILEKENASTLQLGCFQRKTRGTHIAVALVS